MENIIFCAMPTILAEKPTKYHLLLLYSPKHPFILAKKSVKY